MGCCNILTGYAPPRLPPSLNDYPIYIDRLHKEVWYWTGSSWELIWQVRIAGAGTAGVVKVSPSSPITIDAEGNLDIDCGRLKTKCNLATKADIDAAIATITTTINTILTRLGDLETKITNLTVTVTDLGKRITIVEGSVTDLGKRITIVEGAVTNITNINGTATDVTKLKSDVARLDDPMLTYVISSTFKGTETGHTTAAAPYADITAVIWHARIASTSTYITFATYPLSVQNGVWKQLPNSRESITISFPAYASGIPDYIYPNWVPEISMRGTRYPMKDSVSSNHITNVHARLIRGSTPAIDLPADYEAYLPELCATASCAVITNPDGTTKLSDTLDVTIVKHTSTPKGNIVVAIEFSPQAYLPSYLIPIVP